MPYYDDNGNIMPGYAPSAQPTQQSPWLSTSVANQFTPAGAPLPQQAPTQPAAQTPVYQPPVPSQSPDEVMAALQNNPYSRTVDGMGNVLKQAQPFNVYPNATLNNQRDAFVNQNSNISANDMYALTRVSQVMNQAVASGAMSLADAQYKFNAISQTLRPPTPAAPAVGTPSSNANPQQNGSPVASTPAPTQGAGQQGMSISYPPQFYVNTAQGQRIGPFPNAESALMHAATIPQASVVADQQGSSGPGDGRYWVSGNGRDGLADPYMPQGTTRAANITPPNVGSAGLASTSYTVQPGDTLGAIAARVGTDYQTLASLNGIADPNFISVGQQLQLPGGGAPSIAPPSFAQPPQAAPPLPQGASSSFSVPDVVHGGTASFDDLQVAAIRETFPSSEWNTAFHIAAAESKGSNSAMGDAGEVGLFQIHPVNWPGLSRVMGTPINAQTLQDPYINARAARIIWEGSQGWGRVGGNPWATAPGVFAALGG